MSSAITGGIKFFERSACYAVDGATITASSGNSGAPFCLDRNPDTFWRSSSSTDLVTETLTIVFPSATLINRLILLDHNWKQFTAKYDVAGTWTQFSSVYGLDGAVSNISETTFADGTAYYEFASVTTSSIQITVTKTQTANAQKYVAQVIATSELGTLAGFPNIKKVEISKNSRMQKTLSGKYVIMKSIETASLNLDFKDYPRAISYAADMDLMMTLHDRENPFLVWLCGGRRGSTYFGYTLRGFRLKDLFYMQISKPMDLNYSKNIYQAQINANVQLEEHI